MKKLSDRLDDIALNKGFDGEALRLAAEVEGLSGYDKHVLKRYMRGTDHTTDHVVLQYFAVHLRRLGQ